MLTELALLATSLAGTGAAYYARTLFRRLHTDALTGLGNRAELYRRFGRLCLLARHREPVALLLGDVDQFKTLNDTHGHRFGDQVLQSLAGDLDGLCGPGELAVRLHGDEFAVLITGDGAEHAESRAVAISRALSGTRVIDGQPVEVVTSWGAATIPISPHAALTHVLSRADARMYRAKPTRPTTGRSTIAARSHSVEIVR
ncbi:GGDEF domain-containing protein [Bounagaea algeriensis]